MLTFWTNHDSHRVLSVIRESSTWVLEILGTVQRCRVYTTLAVIRQLTTELKS